MLKIPENILSFVFGKFVPVTGYARSEENIFSFPALTSEPRVSCKRREQREKTRLCNEFTSAFAGTDFFNITFPSLDGVETGATRANNIIMDQAITGQYPYSHISYPRVFISKGVLPGAESAAAADNEECNILFNWKNNAGTGTARNNDRAILVAYFPTINKVIFSLDSAIRKDCGALLETSGMEGLNAETWIGFISPDERNAANSRYLGTIYL